MFKYQIKSKQDLMHHLYLQETHLWHKKMCEQSVFASRYASLSRVEGLRVSPQSLHLCGMRPEGGVR